MLQRKALELVVPLWQQRDSHLNRKDVTMTSLIWPTAQNHKQGAHVAAATMSRLHHGPTCYFFFVAFRCRAGGCKPIPLLSAGRNQRRRIMCNYNRQSKTKPFTFNELLLEKGRLPQGGILMKQMAECSQGQTLTVLLFTVCQHFQHSEELHLSLDRSLCASVNECVYVCVCACERILPIDTSHKMERKKN